MITITDILLQNPSFRDIYETHNKKVKDLKTQIEEDITTLFNIKSELDEANQEVKNLGDKTTVQNEINRLESEVDKIRESSGLSYEDNKKYEELSEQKEKLDKELLINDSNLKVLDEYKGYVEYQSKRYKELIEEKTEQFLNRIDDEGKMLLENITKEIKDFIDEEFNNFIRNKFSITETIEEKLNEGKTNIDEIEK
ncbi:hypothetical protein [Tuberibacillus sp. Marseille-P3662]|uniref:hypothetical protein n=1 Tax=Tuberibacillus sp. Marseille-P3662 TaxID=1965358 RepID=UPI00111C8927|nr:hypothetical protein [Tuberibacillus sp. Marseille-P3662]